MGGKVPLVGLDDFKRLAASDHIIKVLKEFDGESVIEEFDSFLAFNINDPSKQPEIQQWLDSLPPGTFTVEDNSYSNVTRIRFAAVNYAIQFKLRFGDLKTQPSSAWRTFTVLKTRVNAKSRKLSAQYTWTLDEPVSISMHNPNKTS